jgi:hypothetical protein
MNPTPDDLLARRIVAHLGEQPEVPAYVAHRLASARATALVRARAEQAPVRVGPLLAFRDLIQSRVRLAVCLAGALVIGYCTTMTRYESRLTVDAWHAEDDSSHYVELLQD